MAKENKTRPEAPTLEQIESERKRVRYRQRFSRTLFSTLAVLIVSSALAVLIATLWMPVLQIYGSSMAPTLEDGEIVVSFKTGELSTGDTVAFYFGNKILSKRVIAGPGDWVDIDSAGNVKVNGKLLDEPYVQEKALGESTITYPYQVPENCWFVMGDNRAVSVDSRSEQMGCITKEQLVGRIVLAIWPLANFGLIR